MKGIEVGGEYEVYEKGECEGSETRSEQRVISDENGNC
jgi:hypothetical protein